MRTIENTDNRLLLTIDKKVYNAKKKKFINVDSGSLRTRVNNKSIVCNINKLHRLIYPELYSFAKKEWIDIEGFEALYQINNAGQILSLRANKILKPHKDKDGYLLVNLYKDKKPTTFKVHRLVAKYFINTKPKETVNHKDGNKENNKSENLEWATRSENNKHAYDNGLKVQNSEYAMKKVAISRGDTVVHFGSAKECSLYLGCDNSFVAKVARGEQETCKGYKIKYITG